MALPIDPNLPPLEARPVPQLPTGSQWRYELGEAAMSLLGDAG